VSVDDRGRILIDDAEFVKTLKTKLGSMKGDSNTICKNAYKCGKEA
jgi:hypothetical protein